MRMTVKQKLLNAIAATLITALGLIPTQSIAKEPTSANGKYHNLIQKLHCPSDRARYGKYRDYGYWGGGSWCGQQGKRGFWVWVAPTWYIWGTKK